MQSIDQLNFDEIAQTSSAVDQGQVYFYTLDNTGINVRKTIVSDFETWCVIYNHYDTLSLILTGAAPVANQNKYTLVHTIADFIKVPLVFETPEEFVPPVVSE